MNMWLGSCKPSLAKVRGVGLVTFNDMERMGFSERILKGKEMWDREKAK